MFHVTSSANRESIAAHGLDWKRMGAASGMAGSDRAEQEGCFLCHDELEADWFVRMNNTGGPVDVWAVEDIDEEDLVESPEGHFFVARPVPPQSLRLLRQGVPPST